MKMSSTEIKSYQKGFHHKADKNATVSKWQNHDVETTSEQR